MEKRSWLLNWTTPVLAVAFFAVGLGGYNWWANRQSVETVAAEGCGCVDCDCDKKFKSEHNQDVSGPSSQINHINPTEVEDAEDIYGAESVIFKAPIRVNYEIVNPQYYETPTGASDWPTMGNWDSYNDVLPEYRFPMPWSMSYDPTNPYRPSDYQSYQTTGVVQHDYQTRTTPVEIVILS